MKKIVIQNLSITIISKLISFLTFLYIAKILLKEEYGLYVYISLILSLLPLLQLGSMNGIIIQLPKWIVNNTEKKDDLFLAYYNISLLIQIISSSVLFLIDINLHFFTLISIVFNYILLKHIENITIYLNANHYFEKANIIKFFNQVVRPITILIIFFFYKTIDSIFIGQLIATFLTFLIIVKIYKFKYKLVFDIEYIKVIYKIGFFVYLTWAIDILFRSADRWFISQFYDLKDLAAYGFVSSLALNIWLLSMSFFSPYTQLLYRKVAENNYKEVKNIIENTNKKLYILLGIISVISLISYPFLLKLILHKYYGTYFLFFVLVLVAILLSINNMYIYYMISNNYHFVLLKYQSFILVLNLVLNSVFSYFHLDIVYFSYSTILSLLIYFVLVRRYFYYDIKKRLENR